jgi:hypothetical protein
MLADIRCACRSSDVLADMQYAHRHPMYSPISDIYTSRHPTCSLTSDMLANIRRPPSRHGTGSSLTGLGLYDRVQGKFLGWITCQAVEQVSLISLFFLWRMHSFSYVRGFPLRVFYTVTSFNEASEDSRSLTVCYCCLSSLSVCYCLSLSSSFLCIFRTRGSVRNGGRPEMTARR